MWINFINGLPTSAENVDQMMVRWAVDRQIPVHILLTKANKLNRSEAKNAASKVSKHYHPFPELNKLCSYFHLQKKKALAS